MRDSFEVATNRREELVDITAVVAKLVRSADIAYGICSVYSPHTTAGITINENADPDVRADIIHALDQLVARHDPSYQHREGNSAAHVKASMMGASAAVPVANGRLELGRWQGIYLCEFDGPRTRSVVVTVIDGTA